ncbi:MAG: hypothetical protein K6T63_01690 [Alicyclobacillus herbarius]|uniref:hypothetical protein n=1 Tax=Alicyclobacillus herbarius TaxID=122960 RepID=UPI0005501568|nr:hypothetical protein [Alicyclobacillus herbarius]MCL6631319.1 hypothetical protein [Alicyclobacillus herbarius]
MCTRCQVEKHLGGWVEFRTPWGYHRGIVEQVTPNAVLMRVPRRYAPAGIATVSNLDVSHRASPSEKLDIALAQWAYGRPYAYGARWGYPGWGAWWAGWWWWWLAFAWIWALAFLWW